LDEDGDLIGDVCDASYLLRGGGPDTASSCSTMGSGVGGTAGIFALLALALRRRNDRS